MSNKISDKNKIRKPVFLKIETPTNAFSTSKFIWIGAILLLTLIAFYPSINCAFINWDDQFYVTDSKLIQSLSFENIKKIFSTESVVALNYHPITILSLAIDYHFANLDPWQYHFTNLFIHILNTILVFFFAYKLSDRKLIVGIFVSLFFGIHPMHVESVAWIAERKDVLYTFFFMTGLLTYLSYSETKKKNFLVLTFIFFFLSVLSKAMAVVFPFVILLIDFYKERKVSWKIFVEKIPFFLVSLVVGSLALRIQVNEINFSYQTLSFFNQICIGFYGLFTYLWKMFLPINLSFFYPYPPLTSDSYFPLSFYLSALFGLLICIITVILFIQRKKVFKALFFGMGFYIITLIMVLQFFSVGKTIMADRYSYVSYIGLLFTIGMFLNNIVEKYLSLKYFVIILISLIAFIFTYLTHERTIVWNNAGTLFTNVIAQYPFPKYYIEDAYICRGNFRSKEKMDFEGAIADYNIILSRSPKKPNILYNLGIIYYLKGEKIYNSGDTLNAMEMFNRSIDFSSQAAELDSMSIPIFMNRAATYIYMKKFDLAALDYNKILKLDPQNTEILEKRAFAYYKSSQWIKAIKDLDKLIFLNPDNSLMLLNRAKAKYNMEFFKEAIDDFNILVRLDPQNANAYYFLAVCYRRLDDRKNAMSNVEKAKQLGFLINEKELKKFQ